MRRPLTAACLGAVLGITAQYYMKEIFGRNWWAGLLAVLPLLLAAWNSWAAWSASAASAEGRRAAGRFRRPHKREKRECRAHKHKGGVLRGRHWGGAVTSVTVHFLRKAVSWGAVLLFAASFCSGSILMLLEMNRGCPYPIAQEETEATEATAWADGTQPHGTGPYEAQPHEAQPRDAQPQEVLHGVQPHETQQQEAQPREVQLAGTIQSVQTEDEYCRFVLQTGLRQRLLVTVWTTPKQLGVSAFSELTGRRARVTGTAELADGRRNPGGFDYRLSLRTKDIFAVMKTDAAKVNVSGEVADPFLHFLSGVKQRFSDRIRSAFSGNEKTGALIEGMLFGDKSLMDDEVYEGFQKNGVAHLLAVSGIHVNVLYLYIRKLMKGRRDPAASAVVLLFLLLYTALSGFSASSVRASLMIAFSIGAVLLRRSYDMCTAAAASALLLLAGQPYRVFDTGFQLSFLAVAALAVVLPWAQQKAERTADRLKKQWVRGLAELLCPLLVIQLVMAPITAYNFQNASWSSFLLNPILIPLAGIIVPLGIAMLPISFLPGAAGAFLFTLGANCIGIPAGIMIACIQFFDGHGWGSFAVTSPPMGTVLLFYAGLFFFCSESRYILLRKGRRQSAALAGALIVTVCSLVPFLIGAAALPLPWSRTEYPMVFVDVGQGDCLHIRTPGGKNVLIDGGGKMNYNVGKKILAPYLLKNGVDRIDLALVTHLHADHYRGIEELAAIFPVERIGMYEGNRVREEEIKTEWEHFKIPAGNNGKWGKKAPEIQYVAEGDRIQLEKDVWIEVLAPVRRTDEEYRRILADETDENASSLVLAVQYKGLRVLMTGDMGFPGEEELLERYSPGDSPASSPLSSHILKTGHHGSKYSTSEEFLCAVNPKTAVIQVGKNNNFGHPSGRVIELFQNYGIIAYRTDRTGAVLVRRIAGEEAVLSDIRKEKIWHIRTDERRSTPTRPSKKI